MGKILDEYWLWNPCKNTSYVEEAQNKNTKHNAVIIEIICQTLYL
jgi:hypothetical protein